MSITSSLRSDKRGPTKLAVLDCVKNDLYGYEGRYHCQTVHIEPDDETTREDLMEAIEEFRVESSEEIAKIVERKQKEHAITSKKQAIANAEYDSWFKK